MTTEKLVSVYEGKAKIVYTTDQPDRYIIHFKDDATAFDGLKKASLKNKGVVNNTITSWIFEYLQKQGIATHFIQKLSDRDMLVHKVTIIPVEVVLRNKATGSITKRLGVPKGTPFEPALLEFFYKSDELHDPLVSESHIACFKWATPQELSQMVKVTHEVNRHLRMIFGELGLELIDFKLEFGRDAGGNVLLSDEFTPDGCRLWDKKTGEPMDKDRFRQDLGGVEEAYDEVLRRLKSFFEREM